MISVFCNKLDGLDVRCKELLLEKLLNMANNLAKESRMKKSHIPIATFLLNHI